jgi:hypothetical protein
MRKVVEVNALKANGGERGHQGPPVEVAVAQR